MTPHIKLRKLACILVASCVIGRPRPAFGVDDPAPAKTDAQKGEGYNPADGPLHGNPNPEEGQAGDQRDETELADKALSTSTGVTEVGGDTSEIQALLSRAESVKDANSMPRKDIVALRIALQRFRGQSDALDQRVDEETNRLEALILDVPVKKGQSITGQTRNLPAK